MMGLVRSLKIAVALGNTNTAPAFIFSSFLFLLGKNLCLNSKILKTKIKHIFALLMDKILLFVTVVYG